MSNTDAILFAIAAQTTRIMKAYKGVNMQFVVERQLFGLSMFEIGWIFISISLTGIMVMCIAYLLYGIWLDDIQRSCEREDAEFETEDN